MRAPDRVKVTMEVLSAQGDDGTLGLAIAAIQEAIDELSEERSGVKIIRQSLSEHKKSMMDQARTLLVQFSKTVAFDVYCRGGNVFSVIDALTAYPNEIVVPLDVASLETIRKRAKKLVVDWTSPGLVGNWSVPEIIGISLIGAVGIQALWNWRSRAA